MSKIDAAIAKKLAAISIKAKSEEEAREKLLAILEKEGIDGMDDESTDTLIDMAESFIDSKSEEESDAEGLASEAEEEPEEEEEEEEEPIKKPVKKAAPKKSEVKKLVKKVEEPEEEEEEEEEEPEVKKPVKKVVSKKESKPVAKKESKQAVSRSKKLDPKNIEEDRKVFFDYFNSLFPKKEFDYAWVSNAGVTIKNNGANSKRAMILVENVAKKEEEYTCNLYLLTFTKNDEYLVEAGIDFQLCWSGAPFIKGISMEEAVEIVSSVIDVIKGSVAKLDKKLGENRKKMEENLKKAAPKKSEVKKLVKKVEEPEEEEEEEEEEPEVKKPVKKVVSKKK